MSQSYHVAVVQWTENDGIAAALYDEFARLGHCPQYFGFDRPIPTGADIVFSFAPYGRFLQIPRQLGRMPAHTRPILVHLNTEGMPDLRIPWPLMRAVSEWRSWLGRRCDADNPLNQLLLQWADGRLHRFRYVGDYHYAYRRGWLDVFADTSAIYAEIHSRHGLPTIYAPWGATPTWYADLGRDRDIDVLWMGKRGSGRRSSILDRVREELARHGVTVYVADNVENSFIFGDERTEFLNRAKITLNITRTWYDDNFSRFALAAPNRSLIVSEPLLPHCPAYRAGTHYVSAPIDALAETILYYLDHVEERKRITDNAYRLATTELQFCNSINRIMQAVETCMMPTLNGTPAGNY